MERNLKQWSFCTKRLIESLYHSPLYTSVLSSKRHNLACTIPTTEDSIEVAFDVLVGDSATWSIKSILELN